MNTAALLSRKLLADYQHRQEAQAVKAPQYPAPFPFGGVGPGPFGGASTSDNDHFVDDTAPTGGPAPRKMTIKPDMSQYADMVEPMPGPSTRPPAPGIFWSGTQLSTFLAGGKRAISQYDYPAGWGATHDGQACGLTQDSASRIATLQAKLNQKLGPEYLSQRPGPGGSKKLIYVEGWKLVDLANEVFGFNGWSTSIVKLDVDYLDCSSDGSRYSAGVSCIIRITLRDGAFHEDVGYGCADNQPKKNGALEKCKKEAVTDATKRALKNFGKLLGNCTYDQKFAKEAMKVPAVNQKFDPSQLHRHGGQAANPAPAARPSETMGPPAQPDARPPAQPATRPAAAPPVPGPSNIPAAEATNGATTAAVSPQQQEAERVEAERQAAKAARLQKKAELERQRQQQQPVTEQTCVEAAPQQTKSNGASAPPTFEPEDEFDAMLGEYDETDTGDVEAASAILEMQIEAADDSGVHFDVHVKSEKNISARRSHNPIKQVQEQEMRPKQAGSVGRFLSPPRELNHVKVEQAEVRRALGRPVGHSFLLPRGAKRTVKDVRRPLQPLPTDGEGMVKRPRPL